MTSDKLRITYFGSASDDYKRLIAEIYCNDKIVGSVIQERGLGLFDFEGPSSSVDPSQVCQRVDLNLLLDALASARSGLTEKL